MKMRLSTEKSELKLSKPLTNYFCVLFLIALYYLWYRYPFQINSSTTSATYSDTPLFLQILKYILFIATIGIYTVLSLSARGPHFPRYNLGWWMTMILVAWLVIQSVIVTIITSNLIHIQSMIFLVTLVPLMFYPYSFTIKLTSIERFLRWFVYIATGVSVLQEVLFITVGRLPALAWPTLHSFRFGSLWDDPNGFAIFLSFIIPFIYFSSIRRSWKILLIAINLVSLMATQSFTGIFANFASLLLVTGCLFLRPVAHQQARRIGLIYLYLTIAAIAGLTALILLNNKLDLTNVAIRYIAFKQGSINGHTASWLVMKNLGMPTVLGLKPTGFFGESGFVDLLVNFGVFALLAYVSFLIAIFWKTIKVLRTYYDQPGIAVFYGAAFFLAAYSVAMVNLPLQIVFPVNLLFVLFAALAFQTRRIMEWQSPTNSVIGY